MKIAIASDHGGFDRKEELKDYLIKRGFDVVDVGAYYKDSCHYPEFAVKCAKEVQSGNCKFGIIICTSGEGVAIAANKVKGIRAGIGYNVTVSRLMREHNDANVITFGAKYATLKQVIARTEAFLKAEFQGGRHATRVQMINDLDK
ncbi:MAG: ribose 5-phosphate isomerase B [Bacilli bacterium]|nr:ribose 5-phosphate isomerase B [Bacilli bacterium]